MANSMCWSRTEPTVYGRALGFLFFTFNTLLLKRAQ